MKYLFDASAFLELIKRSKLLVNNYILDLTIYEIGNAIWKEATLFGSLTMDEAVEFMDNLTNIVDKMSIIHVKEDLDKVMKIAIEKKLTFYDASYLHNAIKHDLVLVTNDKKLYNVARDYIRVLNSWDL